MLLKQKKDISIAEATEKKGSITITVIPTHSKENTPSPFPVERLERCQI